MSKLTGFLLLVILVSLAGGAVFLAMWDIPAPTRIVDKVLPDESLQH